MTKKLQDLLDLPDSKKIIDEASNQEKQQKKYEVAEQKETMLVRCLVSKD
jgi:hypothetical protein